MDANNLTELVVILSLIAGSVLLIAGILLLISEWLAEREVRKVAKQAGEDLRKEPDKVAADSPIKAHGGLDSGINAVANLAKTLKDLERSARLLVVSLAFFAIAGAAAIGGAVSSAIAP
jgi:hypothetical protein